MCQLPTSKHQFLSFSWIKTPEILTAKCANIMFRKKKGHFFLSMPFFLSIRLMSSLGLDRNFLYKYFLTLNIKVGSGKQHRWEIRYTYLGFQELFNFYVCPFYLVPRSLLLQNYFSTPFQWICKILPMAENNLCFDRYVCNIFCPFPPHIPTVVA